MVLHGTLAETLAAAGVAWVRSQRERFRPLGRPLGEAELAALAGFVEPALLADIRVHRVDGIEDPDFYSELVARGLVVPFDFARAAAITFDDTILLARRAPAGGPAWLCLLFHEVVHVVQYRRMGLDRFVRAYLDGWAAAGFRYSGIPLERDAFALEARYATRPDQPFPVEDEVARRLDTRATL